MHEQEGRDRADESAAQMCRRGRKRHTGRAAQAAGENEDAADAACWWSAVLMAWTP